MRPLADETPIDHCDPPVRLSGKSSSSGGTAKQASFRTTQRIRRPSPKVKSEFMNVSCHSDPISAQHKPLATMSGVLGACSVLCASGTGFPNAECPDQPLNGSCVYVRRSDVLVDISHFVASPTGSSGLFPQWTQQAATENVQPSFSAILQAGRPGLSPASAAVKLPRVSGPSFLTPARCHQDRS